MVLDPSPPPLITDQVLDLTKRSDDLLQTFECNLIIDPASTLQPTHTHIYTCWYTYIWAYVHKYTHNHTPCYIYVYMSIYLQIQTDTQPMWGDPRWKQPCKDQVDKIYIFTDVQIYSNTHTHTNPMLGDYRYKQSFDGQVHTNRFIQYKFILSTWPLQGCLFLESPHVGCVCVCVCLNTCAHTLTPCGEITGTNTNAMLGFFFGNNSVPMGLCQWETLYL